ncbi:MAG: lipoate--protein ligase family protein [Arcanobacterium sp.]|nr:lipoate--protein ligase family protein [Arcanobacterium sp.]MDY5588721.1 biotin/lipoate A/B protein ligase family protein [Arcanobacterium sp.]
MGTTTLKPLPLHVLRPPTMPMHINLALDDVLAAAVARGKRAPHLRIWRWNTPQIVIGSGQSVANEVNEAACQRNGVAISRRASGGGAMFMLPTDAITYSVIVPTAAIAQISFQASYELLDSWAVTALRDLGVPAHYAPINDIATPRAKIAGAAQKRYASGVTVHHTTASYTINESLMYECLRIGAPAVSPRGHRSAVKQVDTIARYTPLPRAAVIDRLVAEFASEYHAPLSELTPEELTAAEELAARTYSTPEWTYRIP